MAIGTPRIRRRVRWVALALCAHVALATLIEKQRTAAPLPSGTPRAPELDAAQLRQDLVALAAPEMEGRRAGSPGGLRARAYLVARFEALGLAPAFGDGYLQPFTFEHRSIRALWQRDRPYRIEFTGSANVAGTLPGAAGAHTLVVSAHYDHLGIRGAVLYPGADDNASGVSTLLALAAWVRAHPTRHQIVFAAFDAEEMGLRGAQAFVAHPPLPLSQVDAELNLDMVGRPDGGGLVVTGAWRHPELRPIVETAAQRATVPLYARHERPWYLGGMVDDWTDTSDHGPFAAAGIPFLYLGVEDHDDYHAPGDTPDKVVAAQHAANAEVALDLLRGLDAL